MTASPPTTSSGERATRVDEATTGLHVRFAVAPAVASMDAAGLPAFARAADRAGFDTLWLADLPMTAMVDPLVGLSWAAAATTRIKLGANVVPFGLRPHVLARALAQLDHLSDGRLLLSFVVGADQPGERRALGLEGVHRGRRLEELTTTVRAWWAGEDPALRSRQQPLEVWFGGRGPEALARAGRAADGWLGAALTPEEAGAAFAAVLDAATSAGRSVDPEHGGMSLPYAAAALDEGTLAFLGRRRPQGLGDVADLVPVGPDHLRDLVTRHLAAGISKFVVRPVEPHGTDDAHLAALADVLLPLQT